MSNKEKYNKIFIDILDLNEDFDGMDIELGRTENWDSVGHMTLITEIEDAFNIMMDTEDIISFSSYEEGIKILKKYEIEIIE